MLKNNRKGITLVALIATIMVIVIVTTTAVVSYSAFNVSARKKAFANELYTLQKQIEDYNFKNNKYPLGNAVELDTSDLDEGIIEAFDDNREHLSGNKITLYEIEFKKLDLDSLTRGVDIYGESKDIYLFSKTTKKVYYLKGEKIGDETFYFLSNDLYDSLKMK